MKKIIYFVLTLAVAAALSFSLASCREAPSVPEAGIEKENVLYTLSPEKTHYSVTGFVDDAESFTVLAEIDGLPVTEIGNSAFASSSLKTIALPEGITRISAYAFDGCTKLEAIELPRSVSHISYRAFYNCRALTALSLPESLSTIAASAFKGCSSLASVELNSENVVIEADAFAGCISISELRVPSVAAWCSVSLSNAFSSPLYFADKLIVGGEEVTELTVSDVEVIPKYAFYHFTGLVSLTLGGGVKTVEHSAFSECTSLKSLTIGDSVKTLQTSSFSRLTSLESVTIGSGLNYVGGLSFFGCTALKAVYISDLRAWCGIYFYTDNSGTSNPLYYAEYLYLDGEPVIDLVIPEGTTEIGALTFINLQTIESVTLPASMETVKETAFYVVASIKQVFYEGSAEQWKNVAIELNNASFYTASRYPIFK